MPSSAGEPKVSEFGDTARVLTLEEFDFYRDNYLKGFVESYGDESEEYEKKVTRLHWWSAFMGVLATVLAAVPTELIAYFFPDHPAPAAAGIKWLVVISTATATFFIYQLTRLGVESGYKMRVAGRAEIINLDHKVKFRLLNIAMTTAARAAYHDWVMAEALRIEKTYGGPQSNSVS